ncbi:hypothetical protein ACFSL4_08415 [Streptomyces caeni]|uniref:Uncharacterized protein n=1 Tax=Streptomyces caeni TaxID=2307231 RepID=A0ABW4ILS3_9ACTN
MSDPVDGGFRILPTGVGGRPWRTVDTGSYDTVDCGPDLGCRAAGERCWAAGEQGRVAHLEP